MNINIKEITKNDYNDFINDKNVDVFQTITFFKCMKYINYKYVTVGFCKDNIIIAAAALLIKRIYPFCKYVYIPGGIICEDKSDEINYSILQQLKNYCKKKRYCFIKINPRTDNINYENILKTLEFKKRKVNNTYNYILPNKKITLKLSDFDINKLEKNVINIIKENIENGMSIKNDMLENLKVTYTYKTNIKSFNYYERIYKTFDKENKAKIKIIYIDKEKLLENSANCYNNELVINDDKNKIIQSNPNEKLWNEKNTSDNNLIRYKTNMELASNNNKKLLNLAGALILTENKTIHVIYNSYCKDYPSLNLETSLFYQIIEEYRNQYDFLIIHTYDDFTDLSKKFNMSTMTYIGEFDLILNDFIFNQIKDNKKFKNEFLDSSLNAKSEE